ncbi:MAG: phosphonate C-P lyase system protein PhnG [Tabrizicola sp.]|uniref:phosphonate C-P lyase system protein PhnG n=1 Tax=Tabrizicola sp. TaxID=2005166 RepID=UPI002AB925C2|nr:phosphonate C-P lyase system protein PhnG [Tabrizicola sp.]MDZ4085455.1 phosphonate C-P lyase system protein PhnG [Tabrizicola sp.]
MRPDREDWAAALAAADKGQVAALADRIRDRATVEPLAPPREGLMLMQLRDSVAGAAFHLGEIPMARVHLRLTAPEGTAEGGAALMTDDLALVTRLAILDAALMADLPEAPEIEALLATGMAARAEVRAQRALALDRTKVDFQLLSEDDA